MLVDIGGGFFFKTDKICILVHMRKTLCTMYPYTSLCYTHTHTYPCMCTHFFDVCTLHIVTFRRFLRIVIQLSFVNQWMNAIEETLHFIYKEVCRDSLTHCRCSVNAC